MAQPHLALAVVLPVAKCKGSKSDQLEKKKVDTS